MIPEHHLLPSDLDRLHRFRITDTRTGLHGIRRVSTKEARVDCGIEYRGDLDGVVFPCFGADDTIKCFRLRRDNPEIEHGRPKAKYVHSQDRPHLFFERTSRQHLSDTSVPVVFVEAPTSALAVAEWSDRMNRPLLIVSTGGCWGWRGRIGKTANENGVRVDEKGPSADLDHIPFKNRPAFILFDSNIRSNDRVQAAAQAFTKELQKRGAVVHVPKLAEEVNLNGPDDFLSLHSDADLASILDAAPIENKSDDDEILRRLAALPLIEYDREREQAAEALGVRVSILDRLVDALRPKKDAKGGSAIVLGDPEPWREPVEGAVVLDSIRAMFEKYIVLPVGASVALALFVLHTFLLEAADITPYVAITSPEKRCGKTALLECLQALVSRALLAANITSSALFRTIEACQPTLLIDEADTFLQENEELRGVLNSGTRRSTAAVIRTVGEDHEPKVFSTWCPKVVALIGKPPDTIADRSIIISMQRKRRTEHVERMRFSVLTQEAAEIRQKAVRWATDNLAALKLADPAVPEQLNDRSADFWRCLFAIADQAGERWAAEARAAALSLSSDTGADTTTVQLLVDIKAIFEEHAAEKLASETIVEGLGKMEERPWPEWGKNQKPISQVQLARLLAKFTLPSSYEPEEKDRRIRPKNLRIGNWSQSEKPAGHVAKGYEIAQFTDAFSRYIPSSSAKTDFRSATAATTHKDKDLEDFRSATPTPPVADQKNDKSSEMNRVAAVADQNDIFWKESI